MTDDEIREKYKPWVNLGWWDFWSNELPRAFPPSAEGPSRAYSLGWEDALNERNPTGGEEVSDYSLHMKYPRLVEMGWWDYWGDWPPKVFLNPLFQRAYNLGWAKCSYVLNPEG